MTDPLAQLQRLYDGKQTVYVNGGMSSSVKGRIFVNIWGNPSNVLLARGYGKTFDEALRDALSQMSAVVVICENARTKRDMVCEIRTMISVQDYNFPRQGTDPFCFLHGRLRIVSFSDMPTLYGVRFNWWTGEYEGRLHSWILSNVVTP